MPCGMTRHPAVRRPGAGRSRSALAPAALGIAVLFTAGCGATSASSAASPGSPGPSVSGAAAYLGCLRQHGVTMPTARPTARPTSGAGGFGGGSAAFQKARQACASLRPGGGFGGRFAAAFQAFRSCMASHGETVPTTRPTTRPTAPPTGAARGDRFLNGLNPGNPKVAVALKACRSKLPSFGPGAA